MKPEYEVKILDINIDEIEKKLRFLGAKKIIERNNRRYVYDLLPMKKHAWIRLRDDGQKNTLAIKEINSDAIDGTMELEVDVSDFEKTKLILNKLGYSPKSYQENKRISYKLDDVEIEIDFWPKIPPYLEIEGKTIAAVEGMVKKLGYKMSDTTSINTIKVYKKFGIDIEAIKELKF